MVLLKSAEISFMVLKRFRGYALSVCNEKITALYRSLTNLFDLLVPVHLLEYYNNNNALPVEIKFFLWRWGCNSKIARLKEDTLISHILYILIYAFLI